MRDGPSPLVMKWIAQAKGQKGKGKALRGCTKCGHVHANKVGKCEQCGGSAFTDFFTKKIPAFFKDKVYGKVLKPAYEKAIKPAAEWVYDKGKKIVKHIKEKPISSLGSAAEAIGEATGLPLVGRIGRATSAAGSAIGYGRGRRGKVMTNTSYGATQFGSGKMPVKQGPGKHTPFIPTGAPPKDAGASFRGTCM